MKGPSLIFFRCTLSFYKSDLLFKFSVLDWSGDFLRQLRVPVSVERKDGKMKSFSQLTRPAFESYHKISSQFSTREAHMRI